MATTLNFTPQMAFQSGVFAPGAKAFFYETGTTTPVTVFQDDAYTTPHDSPLVADASGMFAQVFYGGSLEIKVVITASDDTAIATLDPVAKLFTAQSGADQISFAPVTGNAAVTVQAGIANNTSAREGRSAFIKSFLTGADVAEARTDLGLGGLALLDILDEDDMATNSATRPPSQQSVKAYSDAFQATSFGISQTWQDVSGSRAANTSYQNLTGRPIAVSIRPSSTGSGANSQVSTDDATWITVSTSGSNETFQQFMIVPPDHYYRFTAAFGVWAELR